MYVCMCVCYMGLQESPDDLLRLRAATLSQGLVALGQQPARSSEAARGRTAPLVPGWSIIV